MLCKKLGKSGVDVSVISFGAMRWPSEEECYRIMQRGLDLGMNYVDASSGYVNGLSQVWVGKAVRARRGEIFVSGKSSYGQALSADDARGALDKHLAATGLDYFDFYQFWGLERMDTLKQLLAPGGTLEGLRKARRDGLIRHGVGFTFHGTPEVFRAAVDSGEFVSATVSYNLMNRREEENIAYAGGHGVGIFIMNPLAGGVLGLARSAAMDFLKNPRGGPSGPSYGALRFLLANPNITSSLIGFRAAGEAEEAVAALEGAAGLDEKYRKELASKMDAIQPIKGQFCTGCEYCKECPKGVKVPRFMLAMRDFILHGVEKDRLADWIWSKYPHEDPVAQLARCAGCGECEKKCPQHLPIVETISRGRDALAGKIR